MDKYRWLWNPSDVTLVDVNVFYTICVSRYAPEWAAVISMVCT